MTIDLSLYLVTDSVLARAAGHDVVDVVVGAVAGGVTAVQVREKDASAAQFLALVLRVAEVIPAGVALFVNDRVDVFLAARAAGAHVTGVHVGQSDLAVDDVRAIAGSGAVIGVSAVTPAEFERARSTGADYIGVGAVHTTLTKSDAPRPLGAAGIARRVAATDLPVVAIGGVSASDLAPLRRAGAAGAAVVSAICAAPDPERAARALRAAWDEAS